MHTGTLEHRTRRPTGDDTGTGWDGAQEHHADDLLTLHEVRDDALDQRHAEEMFLDLLHALGDGGRHLLHLAVTNADGSLAVIDDCQGGGTETAPTLDNLDGTVDSDYPLGILILFFPGSLATTIATVTTPLTAAITALLGFVHRVPYPLIVPGIQDRPHVPHRRARRSGRDTCCRHGRRRCSQCQFPSRTRQ